VRRRPSRPAPFTSGAATFTATPSAFTLYFVQNGVSLAYVYGKQ
jgi:hypothetical protein